MPSLAHRMCAPGESINRHQNESVAEGNSGLEGKGDQGKVEHRSGIQTVEKERRTALAFRLQSKAEALLPYTMHDDLIHPASFPDLGIAGERRTADMFY